MKNMFFEGMPGMVPGSARFDTELFERACRQKPESFWVTQGQERTLRLFYAMSRSVPAYKDFLHSNGINPQTIKTSADLGQIPWIDKQNYIKKYRLADRCWHGTLQSTSLLAVSSGMSGEPTIWPRGLGQEYEARLIHELLLKHLCQVDNQTTLVVVAFPMGVYVSGVATLLPIFMSSHEFPGLSVMAPGLQKKEILQILAQVYDNYEQIIIFGHPIFTKDIIETANHTNEAWLKKKIQLITCSDGFSEDWRDYVINKIDADVKPQSVMNTYGSSEFLLIAWETPLSILLRRLMHVNKAMKDMLLPGDRLPSVFQYNPALRYIETCGTELLISSATGAPLLRYNTHDEGTVMSCRDVCNHLTTWVPGWEMQQKDLRWSKEIWQLPFVNLYGRNDYTLIFYGFNIYPEHIQKGLSDKTIIDQVTGKFFLEKTMNETMDEQWHVHVELAAGHEIDERLAIKLQMILVDVLMNICVEFASASKAFPDKNLKPYITLWQYKDGPYFKPGVKPRYL